MKTADHARHAIRQVLFFLTLLAVLLIASGHVHAAADRVMYNDGSGLYLQKIRGEWHLRKPNGTPGVGLQYVSIDRTENLTSGYYVFNREGRLLNKTTILRFRQKKSHNVTFDGFYYVPSTGRIYNNARGLIYIDELKCDGYTFKGFYYVDTYGKLNSTIPRVHYISMMKLHGIAFHSGYYCFDKAGRLCIGAGLRRIEEQTEGKIKFKGYYYFDDNGRLYTKEGMIRIGNSFYYLTKEGKMLAGTWMKGRYYLSNGRMAASMMTPDGTWVDEYGRKIEVSEGRLLKLKTKLNSMIAGYGGSWSVYVKDLKTNDMVSINDRSMYPASTIKAFAMAETYNLIAAKKLSYNAQVQNLLTSMITVSDNASFNQLVTLMGSGNFLKGAAILNKYLVETGYKDTAVHHTTRPAAGPFITDGQTNKASARDCGELLENIYRGTCVNKTCSRLMMDLLRRQTRRWKIPSALPASAVVGNKTGETAEVQHDIAIVKGPKTDYVICVFSTTSESMGISGIRAISKAVWDYLE